MNEARKAGKIERFMRDQGAKAVSLYNSGYQDGYEQGRIDWYDKGKEQGYKDWKKQHELIDELKEIEYHKGMEYAWNIARKIESMPMQLIQDVFHTIDYNYVMARMSIDEAVETLAKANMIAAPTKEEEFIVGDEVSYKSNPDNIVVITNIYKEDDDWFYDGIYKDGTVMNGGNLGFVTKTGRHFDISKMLSEIY